MNTKESALLSLVAVLSLAPALPGIEVTYSQYRFLPTELRDDSSANSVQLSEVEFYRGGALVIDAVFPSSPIRVDLARREKRRTM